MRVAAKHRAEWRLASFASESKLHSIQLGREWVDVIEMGAGPPLVLVPGLAGGWKLLAPLAHRLAARHRVIVPGLRGDGSALGPTWVHDLSEHAQDLAKVIANLGLERPAVFGVSFGGAIALELAVSQPHRLGALILQGVEARYRSNLGATIARRVLERFPLPSDNGFVNQFFNLLHGGKPEPGPLSRFIVERCWETDQSVMARRIGMLDSFDVSDRLWQIDVPTLVLAGSRDAIVPPSRQRALAAAIAGARFETLEGAGHVGFLTHRAEVARHVGRLVRQVRHSTC